MSQFKPRSFDEAIYQKFVQLNNIFGILLLVAMPLLMLWSAVFDALFLDRADTKEEKIFWKLGVGASLCFFWFSVNVYYLVLFQSLGPSFFPEHYESIRNFVVSALGCPGRAVFGGDGIGSTMLIMTILGGTQFAIKHSGLYGRFNGRTETWIPPKRVKKIEDELFEREERQYRMARAEENDHARQRPDFFPTWAKMTVQQQEAVMDEWEKEHQKFKDAVDAAPRASYYSRKK